MAKREPIINLTDQRAKDDRKLRDWELAARHVDDDPKNLDTRD